MCSLAAKVEKTAAGRMNVVNIHLDEQYLDYL